MHLSHFWAECGIRGHVFCVKVAVVPCKVPLLEMIYLENGQALGGEGAATGVARDRYSWRGG